MVGNIQRQAIFVGLMGSIWLELTGTWYQNSAGIGLAWEDRGQYSALLFAYLFNQCSPSGRYLLCVQCPAFNAQGLFNQVTGRYTSIHSSAGREWL